MTYRNTPAKMSKAICKYYPNCMTGAKCTFLHVDPQQTSHHAKQTKVTCMFYQKSGWCKNERFCKFSHGNPMHSHEMKMNMQAQQFVPLSQKMPVP